MPHVRRNSNSVIAQAIEGVVDEVDFDLTRDSCQVQSALCRLSSGMEAAFVAMTTHCILQRMEEDKIGLYFEQVFYIPNLRAERKGGFDLSIGNFSRSRRIRTMHKLLYGRNESSPWCDENWHWVLKKMRGKYISGDWHHLKALIEAFNANAWYLPFLVLHICYCVHEYRRMGTEVNGIFIPSFDDILRTVVVDLRPLSDENPHSVELIESEDFILEVVRQAPPKSADESPHVFIEKTASKKFVQAICKGLDLSITLPVYTFGEFYLNLVKDLVR